MFANSLSIIIFLLNLIRLVFFLNDFRTEIVLVRYDGQGQLYHITNRTKNKNIFASTLLSTSVWHKRLGHLGASILDSLRKNKIVDYIPTSKLNSAFCHFYPLGKHIKLSFIDSQNSIFMHFDILHSDVWTSPVSSTSGHKYYVHYSDD